LEYIGFYVTDGDWKRFRNFGMLKEVTILLNKKRPLKCHDDSGAGGAILFPLLPIRSLLFFLCMQVNHSNHLL
jgi:hypothetical protein